MRIKLTNICKDYFVGKQVVSAVRGVSLELEKGEYLSIMGPSGSGKTTLMNIIGCLDIPTVGAYELDGVRISALSDTEMADMRNKNIGFVFQGMNLLPEYDALDNAALPLLYAGIKQQQRREIAREALERVGFSHERLHHKPSQLSGGQQQKVAIARAIVHRPKLLLADEPTGALDSQSGMELMEAFDQLHQRGATIITITHELFIAERANRIIYLRDGKISGSARRREN